MATAKRPPLFALGNIHHNGREYAAGDEEPVRDHYTDAIKWLDKIASGALPLIDATGAAVSQLGTGAAGGGAVAAYPTSAAFGESFAGAWAP
jgi:phage gp36-like protein